MSTAINTDQVGLDMKGTLLECIDQAVGVLSAASLEQYFKEEISWLRAKQEIWMSNRMRVALIGVTSTGKSTLVNSILGGEILPRGVRPTSNTLVTCKHGDELSAHVYYNDGRKEEFGSKEICGRLRDLADEIHNPGNEKGVREIEVLSPGFVFGDSVELVDTPGLDAYGLEWHEELTLQTLLPLVDAVIYITDAKSSSDGMIAVHLSQIQQNTKQTILVQNKMDSVEPELGPCGTVRLDRQCVLKKLLESLEKIAKDVSNSTETISVIQLSAKMALDGDTERSGLGRLAETLMRFLRDIEPGIWRDRCECLHSWLASLIERGKASDSIEQKKSLLKQQTGLDCISDQIEKSSKKFLSRLAEIRTSAEDQCTHLHIQTHGLSASSIKKAECILNELTALKPEDSVLGLLREQQTYCTAMEKELNISSRDFKVRIPHFPPEKKVHLNIRSETREWKEKKGGFFNSIWRCLRVGGYETRSETRRTFDKAQFTADMDEQIVRIRNWVERASSTISEEMEIRYSLLRNELASRHRMISDKLAATVPLELTNQAAKKLEPFDRKLADALLSLPVHNQSALQHSGFEHSEDLRLKVAPSYARDLLMLANSVAGQRFASIRDVMLSRVEAASTDAARRALIVGFDLDCMQDFLQRFWAEADRFDVRPGEIVYREDVCGLIHLGVLLLSNHIYETNEDILRRKLSEPVTVFLLLDAEKPGATKSMLSRSPLPSLLGSNAALVICIESMRALTASGCDSEAEAVDAVLEIARELGAEIHGCMVNDDRIYMTYLVDYLLKSGQVSSVRDEQMALEAIAPVDLEGEAREHIARFLKCWHAQHQLS